MVHKLNLGKASKKKKKPHDDEIQRKIGDWKKRLAITWMTGKT